MACAPLAAFLLYRNFEMDFWNLKLAGETDCGIYESFARCGLDRWLVWKVDWVVEPCGIYECSGTLRGSASRLIFLGFRVSVSVFVGLHDERHTNSVHLRVLQRVCGRLISTEIMSGAVNRGVANYRLSLPLSE